MFRFVPFCLALCLAAAPLAVSAAPAKSDSDGAKPKLLGTDKDWSAYVAGPKTNLVCYIVGHPEKSQPAKAKRGRIALQVTHRPAEKAFSVVSFELGYTAKPDSSADLEIDGKKFTLFTNKDAAWNRDAAADRMMTSTLALGHHAVLTAVSDHGTKTADTYALSGFTHALLLVDKACHVKR
jgi:Invasion associated locus B (IalB) protein